MTHFKNGTLIVGAPGSFMRRMCEVIDENAGLKSQMDGLIKKSEIVTDLFIGGKRKVSDSLFQAVMGLDDAIVKIKLDSDAEVKQCHLQVYIEAAENAGLDWIIEGGPNHRSEVKLAVSTDCDFIAEETCLTTEGAFAKALAKAGVIKS